MAAVWVPRRVQPLRQRRRPGWRRVFGTVVLAAGVVAPCLRSLPTGLVVGWARSAAPRMRSASKWRWYRSPVPGAVLTCRMRILCAGGRAFCARTTEDFGVVDRAAVLRAGSANRAALIQASLCRGGCRGALKRRRGRGRSVVVGSGNDLFRSAGVSGWSRPVVSGGRGRRPHRRRATGRDRATPTSIRRCGTPSPTS